MRSILWSSLLALSCLACQKPTPPVENEAPAEEDTLRTADPRQYAVLFVQQAAEYRALCHQSYQVATDRLRAILQADTVKRPAVILDLDETVLDNSPYAGWQVKNRAPYSPETWQQWVEQAQAEAVPGALPFLKAADSLGVRLFYLTNRRERGRQATLQNLRTLGVPQADSSHLLMRRTTSNKAPRRAVVTSKGFEPVLLLGDNLGDFRHLWDDVPRQKRWAGVRENRALFGRRFILLPNPVYGEWLGATYDYRYDLAPVQKDSLRRAALEAAPLGSE
ncbi:MAG: 5'-nucleotidase, lipoprotein e(P4) family [Schleiferiaceae bacterium]|nr:5'-nucleotidase, lipoprotein e(P4) family [Schleiferiaceae bacterium]